MFAYNTSRHESSKFTPFELMFGRQATLPVDVEFRKASPEEVCQEYNLDEPDLSTVFRERVKRLEEAMSNILIAQQKQKDHYNQKHAKPERLEVDQLVLKKDFTRKKTKGGKLKERYLGPYAITKVLPHGTYELAEPSNRGQTLRATGAHLKPYNSPDEVPDNEYTPPSPDAELPDYDPLSPVAELHDAPVAELLDAPVAELFDAPVAELLDAQSTAPMSPDKHFTLMKARNEMRMNLPF